jgi:hypothetical protein
MVQLNHIPYETVRYKQQLKISSKLDINGEKDNFEEREDLVDLEYLVVYKEEKKGFILLLDAIHSYKNEKKHIAGFDIFTTQEPKEGIPMCKFKLNENGEILKIKLPEGTNNSVYTLLTDMAKKLFPSVKKEMYLNQSPASNTQFFFHQKDKDTVVLFEAQKPHVYSDFKNKIHLKNSQVSQIIRRTIKSGSVKEVLSRDVFNLKGEKQENMELDYSLGMNFIQYKIDSKIIFVENKVDKIVVNFLKLISLTVKFKNSNDFSLKKPWKSEIGQELFSENEKRSYEPIINFKSNLKKLSGINFKNSELRTFDIYRGSLWGNDLKIYDGMMVNSTTKKFSHGIVASTDESFHAYGYINTSYLQEGKGEKTFFDRGLEIPIITYGLKIGPITVGINLNGKAHLKVKGGYEVNKANIRVYGEANGEIAITATCGPDLIVVSFGAKIEGKIFEGAANGTGLAQLEFGKIILGYSVSSCKISVGVYFKYLGDEYEYSKVIFEGWGKNDTKEFKIY